MKEAECNKRVVCGLLMSARQRRQRSIQLHLLTHSAAFLIELSGFFDGMQEKIICFQLRCFQLDVGNNRTFWSLASSSELVPGSDHVSGERRNMWRLMWSPSALQAFTRCLRTFSSGSRVRREACDLRTCLGVCVVWLPLHALEDSGTAEP